MRFPRPTQFEFTTYLEAKVAMVKLWTPLCCSLPVCAVCGWACIVPEGHHLLITRRHVLADLRNLVPVCNQAVGDCHQRAHGDGRAIAIQRLYYIIGHGDVVAGRESVLSATREWTVSKIEVPQVDKTRSLWAP